MTVRSANVAPSEPLSDLNITPLIDVLLVLIVMLILTIPIVTHKVPIELPAGTGPATTPSVHRITIGADGVVSWDGVAVSDAALPARLQALSARPGEVLEIAPDANARYDRFAHVITAVKRAGVTRLGFVSNERFRDF